MRMRSHDTDPDGPAHPHVPTDPGLGAAKTTETGPPAGVKPSEVTTEPGPSSVKASLRDAASVTPILDAKGQVVEITPIPVEPLPAASPDPTPVPPGATERLLNGLLRAENDAYFHKTKQASESSGEGAAAFHTSPRLVDPGNSTPPPEPPVLLRRSVEKDIADLGAGLASKGKSERRSDPPSILDAPMRRGLEPTDISLPKAPGRSHWVERIVAVAGAAVAVTLLSLLVLRWMKSPEPDATPAPPTAPATAEAPTVAVPTIPVSALPAAPATDTATAPSPRAPTTATSTAVASAVPPPRPGGVPRATPPASRPPGLRTNTSATADSTSSAKPPKAPPAWLDAVPETPVPSTQP